MDIQTKAKTYGTLPKKFSVTNYAQLITHGLNNIVSIFVSTFLISYIYQISNNYVLNIGLFYAFNYISMGILYFVVSTIIDKTNRVGFYRLAIVIRTLFILAVVFVGKTLAEYVIVAGILHGASEACYWTSFNIMQNELVRKSLIKKYSTLKMIVEKVVNIIVPLVFGSLIDAESFKSSAIIVLIVAVIQIISSSFICSHRPDNSSFDFKDFIQKTKDLGEKKTLVLDCVINGGIYGFYTTISPMITIMIMYSFNSTFSLGVLTSVFSICAMAFLIILNRGTKTGKRKWYFLAAATLPLISSILLVLHVSKVMVAIFNVVYLVLSMVHIYTYDISRNVVLKKLGMYECIAEFQCAIECFMAFCRVIGFVVMIVAGVVGAQYGTEGILIAAKIMTVLSTASLLIINLRLMKYEKKLVQFEIS